MNTDNLSFGQRVDPENGLVECWFTHGALDEIKSMDLSNKVVWMFGGGLGDSWLAKKCRFLYIVERDTLWLNTCSQLAKQNNIDNIEYISRPCNDSSGMDEFYTELLEGIDVIINDDAYRYEVCVKAVDYFKKRGGGILICDNWIQSFVWISPKSEEVMKPFPSKIFEQHNHLDHDGVNKWKTAIFYI